MTDAMEVWKSSAMAKQSKAFHTLTRTIERARQRYNERHARIEADFMEEVREAVMESTQVTAEPAQTVLTPEPAANSPAPA